MGFQVSGCDNPVLLTDEMVLTAAAQVVVIVVVVAAAVVVATQLMPMLTSVSCINNTSLFARSTDREALFDSPDVKSSYALNKLVQVCERRFI